MPSHSNKTAFMQQKRRPKAASALFHAYFAVRVKSFFGWTSGSKSKTPCDYAAVYKSGSVSLARSCMIHFIPSMLHLVSMVWPWILRRFYRPEQLQAWVAIEVSASGERIQYNYSAQTGSCYLTISNMSPFDYTLDRIQAHVVFGGTSFSCANLIPQLLKRGERKEVYIHGHSPVTYEAAQFAKGAGRGNGVRIEIVAYFESSIWPFVVNKSIEDLKGFALSAPANTTAPA